MERNLRFLKVINWGLIILTFALLVFAFIDDFQRSFLFNAAGLICFFKSLLFFGIALLTTITILRLQFSASEILKRFKFYFVFFFKNDYYVGFCEYTLILATLVAAIVWLKYDRQDFEPITLILACITGVIDVTKRLVRAPQLPRLTFTEATSESSRESSFFIGATLTSLSDALITARQENKGLFIVIYDPEHSTNSQLDYCLGYFSEYQITKRLINQNFVQAIVSSSSTDTQRYTPQNYHMEKCLLVVLDRRQQIISQEEVYANPDEGLKRVRQCIDKLNMQT